MTYDSGYDGGALALSSALTMSLLSCIWLWPCDPMNCNVPGFLVLHSLPQLAQIHFHWVDDVIQSSHPLSSPSPPTLSLSQPRVFSNESALHITWPKYWSCSFSTSDSNEYSRLIFFRIGWFDLLSVWGNLKTLLQHHSMKASKHQCLAFCMVQLSHLHMTMEKP